jgi:hypothetical protein
MYNVSSKIAASIFGLFVISYPEDMNVALIYRVTQRRTPKGTEK